MSKARLLTIGCILVSLSPIVHSAHKFVIPLQAETTHVSAMTLRHETALIALFSATRFAWAPGGR